MAVSRVLGACGGLELKVFAETQPGWRCTGVYPSAAMLKPADVTLGSLASLVDFIEGTIDAAPEDLFDGATWLVALLSYRPNNACTHSRSCDVV